MVVAEVGDCELAVAVAAAGVIELHLPPLRALPVRHLPALALSLGCSCSWSGGMRTLALVRRRLHDTKCVRSLVRSLEMMVGCCAVESQLRVRVDVRELEL